MTRRERPFREREAGSANLALIVAVVFGAVALVLASGMVVGMVAWMADGHMDMMRRGRSGADQTPVVSQAARVTVEMRDFEFFPADLRVDAGTEVTWINRDSAPHNAVAEDGAFDTGQLDQDESASVVIDQAGVYAYVCTYHPGMEATLTVVQS